MPARWPTSRHRRTATRHAGHASPTGVAALPVEVLQAAAADATCVRLQWDRLERGSSEPLPPRSTFTTHRQATRLRMLLAESDTRIALDELEAATAGMEDSAGSPIGRAT